MSPALFILSVIIAAVTIDFYRKLCIIFNFINKKLEKYTLGGYSIN